MDYGTTERFQKQKYLKLRAHYNLKHNEKRHNLFVADECA